MNWRTTQWLLGGALALALFILLFERHTPSTTRRRAEAARLLPGLDPRGINRLEIRLGTNRPVILERGTNTWFFRAPLLYPARAEPVDRFLQRLAEAPVRAHIPAGEVLRQTNALAAYGLAPPALSLRLDGAPGPLTLLWSRPASVGAQVFVQIVGRDGLEVVDAALPAALPASFDAWRDPTLVDLSRLAFDRLEVRPLTNGFEAVRDPATRVWTLSKPLPLRANQALLEHLLQQLELLRVVGFAADPPVSDAERFGLAPPQRELIFARGTNEVLSLRLGRPPAEQPDLLPVWLSTYSNVVLVPGAPLRPWFDGFTNFCDRRLLIFELEQVRRLEVRADEAFAVERGPGEDWRIVEPYSAPADRVLVLEALSEMAGLEFLGFAREVATDFAPYGLDPPRRQYLLRGARTSAAETAAPVLARVDYGLPADHRFYARRSLENSVVLALDPVRLPRAAFELRDRRLWNVSTNDLTAIVVRAQGRERKLVRLGPMQWAAAESSGPPPNPVTLEEAAYRLGQLLAERWTAQGAEALPRYGIGPGAHEIVLEVRGAAPEPPYRVRFGRQAASGRTYAAVTLPEPPGTVIFECPASIYAFVQSDLSLPEPAPAPATSP